VAVAVTDDPFPLFGSLGWDGSAAKNAKRDRLHYLKPISVDLIDHA
jgi:hypothetical protein